MELTALSRPTKPADTSLAKQCKKSKKREHNLLNSERSKIIITIAWFWHQKKLKMPFSVSVLVLWFTRSASLLGKCNPGPV